MELIELGTLLKIEKGKKPLSQSAECCDGMLPYVDIQAFEKGEISSYTDGEKCLSCEDGDILIVCDGSRSGLVGKAIKGYVGSTLAKISAEGLLNEYLYYFVQGKYALLNTNKKGTGTPHLKAELLKAQKLIVPSLEKQKGIVSRIEELLSQLDDGVETLNKTKEQLKVYRQAVLQDAFKNCDKNILIRDICEHVTDGDHMPPPKANEGIPFIMISNIENNRINWHGTAFVENEYFEAIDSKRKPQKGDILYTVTGSFGIPVLVDFEKEFCFQRHIALLRPNERILHKYFYYALQAPDVFAQASRGATGTAQKTVGLGVLRKIIIPYVDSMEKQNEIATEIENRMSVCDYIEQTVNNALLQAEALRQSILKKAFEGEL